MKSPDSPELGERRARTLAGGDFAEVCSAILGPYLEVHGFRRSRSGPDRLSYRRGRCVLEFGYVPYVADRRPRYAVTAAIGVSRGWLRKPRLIGLWQGPTPDRGSNRWQWEFRGPGELKRSLKRLVRLLDEYARPLWEDESKLLAVLAKEWPIYLELANP